MEAVLGVLCLLVLSIVGIGASFWLMYQRISQLQDRLFEVELKIKRIEMAPPATHKVASATPIMEMSESPPFETPSPAPADLTPVTSAAPLASPPVEAPHAPSPTVQAPRRRFDSERPLTLPPVTTIPVFVPPAAPTRSVRKAAASFAKVPLIDWFLRMHVLVQIGLVVLFIGVALLLRYAVDQGWLSIELRHIGAAVGGAALGIAGWAVRKRRRSYGLALGGGGLAILYLTTFSAFRVYELLPAPLAFGIFVALGAAGVALALIQNARIMAYASLIGAFAAPLLASTGEGSYAGLLGYYAVLVVAALAIAVRKGWFGLGLLALLATYGVGIAFTVESFTPADYLGMQLFVLLFFGLFLAATLLFAARGTQERPIVELVLAVLNPLAALVWQAGITDHIDKGLGWSALAGGLIYLLVFGGLMRLDRPWLRIQRELSLFWAIFLASLAVPVFFEAQVTAAIWAVAGALWVWLAGRQSVRWLAPWGLVTQVAAGIAFVPATVAALDRAFQPATGHLPFVDEFAVGWALLGLAGLVSSYFVQRMADAPERTPNTDLLKLVAVLAFAWGAAWWFGGGIVEATTVPDSYVVSAVLLFVTASCVAMALIGGRLRFALLAAPLWGLLPVIAVLALLQPWEIDSPLQGGAWLAWPLALASHGWMVRRNDGKPGIDIYHAGGVWLVAYLAAVGASGLLTQAGAGDTLIAASTLLMLAGVVWVMAMFAGRLPAPIGNNAATYLVYGAGPVALAGIVYLLYASVRFDGAMTRLPYLPLLNPLGLASAAMLAASLYWLWRVRAVMPSAGRTLWSLRWVWVAVLVFAVSAELARIVHNVLGVPFTFADLYGAELYQMMLSVTWGVMALGFMVAGNRSRSRARWFAGAIILAITVVKLFLVDLSGIGTVARIVSFIGVGLLILLIAFVAPAPHKVEAEATVAEV